MMEANREVLSLFLLVGGSLLAGYAGHRVFKRFKVSDILLLLAVGVLVGPVLGLVDGAVLKPALPFLAPIALAVVLFEGGLDLGWDDVRRHVRGALALSILAWTLTSLGVGLVAHLLLGLSPVLALLFGVAVAATGILVVVPLLQQIRAPADARVLLTVETSLGDLLSAVVVTAVSSMLVLGASPWEGGLLFGVKLLVGAAVGLLAGVVWARILHVLGEDGHGWPLTLAAILVAYAATEALGGSGFLCALVFGLFLGNAPALVRLGGLRSLAPPPRSLRVHQSEAIFILRSVYFVYLGTAIDAAIFAPRYLLVGLAFVAALLLARLLAVGALRRDGDGPEAGATRILLVAMMPRGLATAVIAGIPAAMGVPGSGMFLTYTFLIIVMADVATSLGLLVYQRARGERAPPDPEPAPAALGSH
jgi:cell volume regulation protein A